MRRMSDIIKGWSEKTGGLSDYFVFLAICLIIILILGAVEQYGRKQGFQDGYEAGYHAAVMEYDIEVDE